MSRAQISGIDLNSEGDSKLQFGGVSMCRMKGWGGGFEGFSFALVEVCVSNVHASFSILRPSPQS